MRTLPGTWIDAFLDYLADKGSPVIYARWAAIYAISAALERKVWIKTKKGKLYPNIYVVTVGPPGAGKSLATGVVQEMLEELEDHHIAPSSVTKASLIDALNNAERRIIRPGEDPAIVSYNALSVVSNELGTFLPAYENDFMNVLTDIYDGRVYSETRRTNKISIKIDNPFLNLAAATTPSYLNALLPEGAWDQGFLSRTMLIYSGAEAPSDIFGDIFHDDATQTKLILDLQEISKYYGKMEFTEDAVEVINAWHKSGGAPAPDHPKLQHYNTRRTAHLLKLSMVASVADNESLVINIDHVAQAMDWLIEAEGVMPDIFKSMKSGGDGRTIEEAYHYLYQIYVKEKSKPVAEFRLFNFLQERTPAHNVERIVKVMEQAGLIKKLFIENGYGYQPMTKRAG